VGILDLHLGNCYIATTLWSVIKLYRNLFCQGR